MNAIQLDARKLDIIKFVTNTNDEKMLTKLWNIYRQAEETSCERISGLPHTDEECIASVRESIEDYRTTGVSFSMEEMRAKHPRL